MSPPEASRGCTNTTAKSNTEEDGEWHTVSSQDKKRVMRKNRRRRPGVAHPTAGSFVEINDSFRLQNVLQTCREVLKDTALYQEIVRETFEQDVQFEEILCYGLGNFSRTHTTYFSPSLWQLACLLQLRDDLPGDNANRVYFFDPKSSAFETEFLKTQQVIVLEKDDEGKRKIPDATLLFMVHCPAFLFENLFATNPMAFRPSSRTILIGNSIQLMVDALSRHPNGQGVSLEQLKARASLLDEKELTVDPKQPDEFEKAFNSTYRIRGKQEA